MTKKEIEEWEEKFDKIYPKIIRSNMELTEMKVKMAVIGAKLDELEREIYTFKYGYYLHNGMRIITDMEKAKAAGILNEKGKFI